MPDTVQVLHGTDHADTAAAPVVFVEAAVTRVVEVAPQETATLDVLAATATVVEAVTAGPAGQTGPAGPPGPVGPLGGYVVTQATPAATWTFTHTVGRLPVVITYDVTGRRIFPDTAVTATQVALTFAFPMAGTAVLL